MRLFQPSELRAGIEVLLALLPRILLFGPMGCTTVRSPSGRELWWRSMNAWRAHKPREFGRPPLLPNGSNHAGAPSHAAADTILSKLNVFRRDAGTREL